MHKRDVAKALGTFEKGRELAPRDPRGPFLVGMALRAQGRRAEARKQFEAALALAPGFVDPLTHLAAMSIEDGKLDAAVERIDRQIALSPRSGPLHYLLGRVHHEAKHFDAAEAAYRRALELEPGLVAAYATLGHLYGTTGKTDQALATLEKARSLTPGDVTVLMLTGIAYEGKGDIEKAKEAYAKALEAGSGFAPAANNLAWLHAEHGGNPEEALRLAQMAKEAAPDDPHVADTLGWVMYKRGLYQRAVGLLRESAVKLPDSPIVQYHLGMAYYRTEDREAARQALAQAVRLDSTFRGVQEAQKVLAELN
jgi:tetratricopeptide (TPR) repeat protein